MVSLRRSDVQKMNKAMKYCGVVTDRSWYEVNPLAIRDTRKNRPRIYSDEVPMADEKMIEDVFLSGEHRKFLRSIRVIF